MNSDCRLLPADDVGVGGWPDRRAASHIPGAV